MGEMQPLGGLWRRKSAKTGSTYYTGDIEVPGAGKVKVIAFDNDRKTKHDQPDIRLFIQEDRPQSGGYTPRQAPRTYSQPAPASPPAPPVSKAPPYPTPEIDPEDIPF